MFVVLTEFHTNRKGFPRLFFMWDYCENCIYESLLFISVSNKSLTIFLHKAILKVPACHITPSHKKVQFSVYYFFTKNPNSIPLLPEIIIWSYNNTLRMIYALKTLLIIKQIWCVYWIKTLLHVMNDCSQI